MSNFVGIGARTAQDMLRHGEYVHTKFARQVAIYNPLHTQPGRCGITGKWLSHDELNPRHAMPRFFKREVYERIVFRSDVSRCALCDCGQTHDRQSKARHNPRLLEFHLCPECLEFVGLIAAVVHNVSEAIAVMHSHRSQAISHENVSVFENQSAGAITHQPMRAISHQPVRAISHQPVQSADDLLNARRAWGMPEEIEQNALPVRNTKWMKKLN